MHSKACAVSVGLRKPSRWDPSPWVSNLQVLKYMGPESADIVDPPVYPFSLLYIIPKFQCIAFLVYIRSAAVGANTTTLTQTHMQYTSAWARTILWYLQEFFFKLLYGNWLYISVKRLWGIINQHLILDHCIQYHLSHFCVLMPLKYCTTLALTPALCLPVFCHD